MKKLLSLPSRYRRLLLYAGIIGVMAVPTLYGIVAWKVETAINAMCARASREFPGNRVETLIAYVSTDTHSDNYILNYVLN